MRSLAVIVVVVAVLAAAGCGGSSARVATSAATTDARALAVPAYLQGGSWECRLRSTEGGFLTVQGPGAIEACGDLIANALPPGEWRVYSIRDVAAAGFEPTDPKQFVMCRYNLPLEGQAIVEDFTAEGDAAGACAILDRQGWEKAGP